LSSLPAIAMSDFNNMKDAENFINVHFLKGRENDYFFLIVVVFGLCVRFVTKNTDIISCLLF
jgi:hypothetical protein